MGTQHNIPVVIAISGSDPTGGAGIQADIEALVSMGCHTAPVVTAPAAEQGPVRLTVRQAQQRLVDKGYDAGVVDGIWGPRTANALRQFQRDQGLMATGRLDGETMNALGR